jgi:endonuclease/exonuclease/phosphatase family metal-dependent hydrolase
MKRQHVLRQWFSPAALALVLGIFTPVFAATPDIVLYISDAAIVRGNWASGVATDGAAGQLVSTADDRWATTEAPLASPTDVVEATFTASAGTPYHVWLRLRAAGNSKYNDSVWVQFSDAIDANGAAIYRVGSPSALLVNLENCYACGVSGWGWQDKAYWLNQPSTVRFAASGTHTIRIQTREDGVQMDQIVLSASTYLTSAPGQVTNDATIVPKPGGSTAATTPVFGSPAGVPGTIRAQDFDNGGEGIAYHDTTAGNTGGAYRSTDVDLEPSSDGGNDVGWVAAGEWLNYTLSVGTAAAYTVTFRVASLGQGGTFHLDVNGANVSGAVAIPDTGGWQNWQSVTKTVTLAAGTQNVRLVMDTGGPAGPVGNINSMQFTMTAAAPYNGTATAIPGAIAASNFDNGGEGVSYHDISAGNDGGAYRATGVDLEASTDGGYDIGWIAAGEWVNYTVNVASAGPYTAQLRVASPGGGSMHLGFNSASSVWAAVPIPATGGWQNWTTVNVPLTLGAGRQLMTLLFDTAGFNITSINVVGAVPQVPQAPVPAVPVTNVQDGAVWMTVTPTLSWQAAGATSYELRLSTVNPPTTYASNLSTYYYGPSALSLSTKYYWQVVAKNAAGSTAGPVWSFTTEGGTVAAPLPPAPTASSSFRMLTWNIHHGYTASGKYDPWSQAQFIVQQKPDVVALQEVQTWNENQPVKYKSMLEQLTGQPWSLVWAPVINTPGTEGNVLLTRLPVVSSTYRQLHATSDWTAMYSNRSVAQMTVLVGGVAVNVFSTHLDYYTPSYRTTQEQQLMAWLWNFSGPRMVGGDFNSWWGEYWITTMESQHTDTWRDVTGMKDGGYTVNQAVRFDYIFRSFDSNWRATPTRCYVPVTYLSDHNPVVADFKVQ